MKSTITCHQGIVAKNFNCRTIRRKFYCQLLSIKPQQLLQLLLNKRIVISRQLHKMATASNDENGQNHGLNPCRAVKIISYFQPRFTGIGSLVLSG
jgi:hypothetical protein